MKTQVYSWRISSGLKSDLERVARHRKVPVSTVLDTAVREWLAKNGINVADDEEQKRLHALAERYFGVIKGKDPHRSERLSELMRKSLRRKYGR